MARLSRLARLHGQVPVGTHAVRKALDDQLEKRSWSMQRVAMGIAVAALLALPVIAVAQTKQAQSKDQLGQSEYSPGQRQKEPGQAKKYAPGQQEHRYDKDKQPGAKEYAPGHQSK